jgi:hypothetical protein
MPVEFFFRNLFVGKNLNVLATNHFLEIRVIRKMIRATTITTKIIPVHTPALKIPAIASQLVREVIKRRDKIIDKNIPCRFIRFNFFSKKIPFFSYTKKRDQLFSDKISTIRLMIYFKENRFLSYCGK